MHYEFNLVSDALCGHWHTTVMTKSPPPEPQANDVWVDDAGAMKYFNGAEWILYFDLPDVSLEPNLLERDGSGDG
jgi:hypothetical protein